LHDAGAFSWLWNFFGLLRPVKPDDAVSTDTLQRWLSEGVNVDFIRDEAGNLAVVFGESHFFVRPDPGQGEKLMVSDWLLSSKLLQDFFADRLKVQQREAGVRHDLIDAVFALGGEDDLVRLLARVRALQDFVETADGADLLTAYKRAANILKKEKWEGEGRQAPDQVRGDGLEPQEAALVAALDKAEPKASKAVEKEDFTAAMAALASLRSPIDAFFDHVTVNDPDKDKRARRLDLLMRFRDAVNRVADFSRIEG
jgi:glycyl-tRNA synthetase beta subunit